MKLDKKLVMPVAVAAVIAALAGFYCGDVYGQQSAASSRQQAMQQFRGQRPGGQNGGFVNGDVLSKDEQSITVKMRDGSSKIVLYSGSTSVTRPAPGTMSDVAVGTQITVVGTQNSDGSVTAQSIQLRQSQQR